MRIGTKFKYNSKRFEIVDIVNGVSASYVGKLVFYKNRGTSELKVKTEAQFITKFKDVLK